MCVLDLPVAVVPLWQVEHVPGAMPVWFIVAVFHDEVLWQVSQDAVVGMWFADLPAAVVPLWQVAQVPGAMPVWFIVAGFQLAVLWQVSHA